MPKPTHHSDYPDAYRGIWKQIVEEGHYEFSGTMDDCMALRFDLYGHKRALARSDDPLKYMASRATLIIQEQPDGSAKLIGLRRDNTKLAQMAKRGLLDRYHDVPFGPTTIRQAATSGHPNKPPAEVENPSSLLQPAEDPMSSALRKLGFFTQGDKEKKS